MVKSGVELLLKPSGVTLAQSTNGRVLVCNNHAEIAGASASFTFFSLFSLSPSLFLSNTTPTKTQCFPFFDIKLTFFLIEISAVGIRSRSIDAWGKMTNLL